MAGYGGEKFGAVEQLTQSEVVNLWANLQNKNNYLVSQDGMVFRDGQIICAKGVHERWQTIAWIDLALGAIFVIRGERTWAGPARALVRKEVERLCGKNGVDTVANGMPVTRYTMPRQESPVLSPEDIHRVTGFAYAGGTLRVSHANGHTTSYHFVDGVTEEISQQINPDVWKDNPEAGTTTTVNLSMTVRMAESRYDRANDVLPTPYTVYYWPDGQWSRNRYDGEEYDLYEPYSEEDAEEDEEALEDE